MIVPMKKVTVIVQAKDAESAVAGIEALGALHVEHQHASHGQDVQAVREDIELADAALNILGEARSTRKECLRAPQAPKDWRQTARHIVDMHRRFDQLNEYSHGLKAQIASWQIWGHFDPADIRSLAGQNIFIRLFAVPRRELTRLSGGFVVERLVERKGMVLCAVVSREPAAIPFQETLYSRYCMYG